MPVLESFLREGEARKLLFGSDAPVLSPGDCHKGWDDLALSEADAARMLHGNAGAIFGLSGTV